jgi:hypothetical protein
MANVLQHIFSGVNSYTKRLIHRFEKLSLHISHFCYPTPQNLIKKAIVKRLADNPVITFETDESLGNNINGPSVIRMPAWVEKPLGKYYMYFAHHEGNYIRLAYADSIRGPWEIYLPGTLNLNDTPCFKGHIASPDVHVDDANLEIRMYFHGLLHTDEQKTGIAFSKDGIHFNASNHILGSFYFRVFSWHGVHYAIAKNGMISGELLKSENGGLSGFQRLSRIIPRMRHAAVMVKDDYLLIFFTRIGDAPERIMVSTINLANGVKGRNLSEPVEVVRPEMPYEGTAYPLIASGYGSATNVCQLRDPAVLEDHGKTYLFYSVAGESGIAVAEIDMVLSN